MKHHDETASNMHNDNSADMWWHATSAARGNHLNKTNKRNIVQCIGMAFSLLQ
jgi:hypothetical protein